jgi:hypothetical protein
MNINRRRFIGKSSLTLIGMRIFLLTGTSLSMVGCNLFTDIENWVPVGIAAVNSILGVLSANGVVISGPIQMTVTVLMNALNAVIAAIKEYQSTSPAPAGTLAKVELAVKDVVDQFGAFLNQLNVLPAGLFAIISGLAQVVISTITAFMNELPATSTAAYSRAIATRTTFRVGSLNVAIVPKKRTIRSFKKDFNSTLDGATTLGVAVPKTAYLKLTLVEHL